jgi:probable HAF family extracellular repeat protein
MKSRILMLIAVMTCLVALAIPLRLAAQKQKHYTVMHHHYKLIDMGTFGGPVSSINYPFSDGTLNSRGVTVGWSATSASTSPTSNPFICGGLDAVVPFITHAFQWDGAVTDLGALPPSASNCSEPFWVNDKGEVVGASENGQIDPLSGFNQARAVLWKDGEITDLGSFGGYDNAAFGINNRGQIAGISSNTIPDPYCLFFESAQLRAFLWEHGEMQDLGTLGGNCANLSAIDTTGNPINERGQIVGASTTSSIPNAVTGMPPWDPFLWEKGKGMTDLGTLGGAYGGAQAINNRDQVVGLSSIAADPAACNGFPDNNNFNCHNFLWDKGTLIDLNTSTIGGKPQFVAAINDAGEIVGWGVFPDAPTDAFLWRNGVATDLGNLGDCFSSGHAINSDSQVVGLTISCDGTIFRAFLWAQGSIVDLETLIPPGSSLQLATASDINDRGEINGIGVPPGVPLANFVTQGHGFLLIPCDENHPGIQGCDYSMVETASGASSAQPAVHGASVQMPPSALWRRNNRIHLPGPSLDPRN